MSFARFIEEMHRTAEQIAYDEQFIEFPDEDDEQGGHACDCGHGDPCYDCNLGEDN